MTTRHPGQRRDLAAGEFQPAITSFTLHLNAEGKSPKTVRTYVEATQWFAAAHLRSKTEYADWDEVTGDDIRRWMVWLLDSYSDAYANNQYRALQQFFKWWSDDEDLPNPMVKMSPPVVGEKVVPVFTEAELKKLLKACEGRDYDHRRDLAIMSLFKDTGMRLAELAGIRYVPDNPERNDIDLQRREIRVRGKGNKERIVKFGHETARAVDRYIRIRDKHTQADNPRLWLGTKNRGPMTASGIYQMVARRGGECGVTVHPHKFRHHFSHSWLDRGGAEGDLMELNGWTSPQMLRRYGASARSARARRTYDRIMEDRDD